MLPCSMTRSLPRSDSSACAKPGSSVTFLVPCSTTITWSRTECTSSSEPIWASSLAQKSGRFIVVMPMVAVPEAARSAGTSATQVASSRVAPSAPAITSNQYHPPSPKGVSGRSKRNSSRSGPDVDAESTRCERPFGIER